MTPRPATNDIRFSVGRSFAVWGLCFVAALPLQAVVFSATGHSSTDPDLLPTSVTVLGILCLWVPFAVGLVVNSRTAGTGRFTADYRLRARWWDLIGIPVGVVGQLGLIPLLYWGLRHVWPETFATHRVEERATRLWDRAHGGWVVVLVVVVAVGAPIVEELVYRAMIQQSLQARVNEVLAWARQFAEAA